MHSLATATRVAAFVLTASFATRHSATQAPSGADGSRGTHRDAEVEANRFLVHLQEASLTSTKLDALATSIEALGGRIEHRFGLVPVFLVTIDGSRVAALSSLPLVSRVEPDRWHCPTIKTSTDAAHHASDALTARGITGKGATIGIIDTGIDEAISASPPSANLFPGLPGSQRLTPGQRIAIRVPGVPAGKVGGFDLWCGASQNVTLPLTVHADLNGLPDPTPLASSRLGVVRDTDFVSATLATPITLTVPTTLWFAFTPPTGVDFDALVECGVASDVVIGASTRSRLELGYRVVVDGRVARAHRSFYESGNPTLQPRIAVQKKVGALDPGALDQHGTSMAAIAAGSPWSATNADSGHAPGARIASYGCADDSQGNALTSTILKAWEKLACDVEPLDIEAAVIGFSGSPDPLSAEQRMLDAVARNTDLLVVSAAGNNGQNTQTSPATVNGLSVGAADANKAVASFSSFGTVAGMAYPDLVAHGVGVVTPASGNESRDYIATGTSMAAAQVAGAALLVRAANPSLDANAVRAVLLASTEASPGSGSNQVSTGAGCGYLRDDRAWQLATTPGLVGNDTVSRTRMLWYRDVPVTSGQDYAFAIAWMRNDLTKATWSNLDLVVKDSRGNPLVRSIQRSSTHEFVRLRAPTTDTLRIEVAVTSIDVPIVKFAFASTLGFGLGQGTARYSEFETGCKGSGTGGGCPALKQDPQDLSFCPGLPPKTRFACLVQCPCSVDIKGFALRCRASVPNTPMQCYLYKSTLSLEPQLVASATAWMTVQTAEGYYSVTFPSPVALTSAEAANFFIAFRTPDTATIWADHGTERLGHHFEMPAGAPGWTGGTGYQNAITEISWDWKVSCSPGLDCPGGMEPCLEGEDLPIVGSQRFAVRLLQGLPNGLGILMTGVETRCLPLAAIGAQACNLCCNTIYNVGAVLDGQGLARIPFPVPQTNGLVGVEFAQQWLLLDTKANRLGLTLSGPGRARVGTH